MRRSIRRALGAALLFCPIPATAQVIRGIVRNGAGAPLSGVVTLLRDSASAVVARQLTNAEGAYRLTAPRAGQFSVQTLRLGFQPSLSDVIALETGADVVRNFTLSNVQIALDTVRVIGQTTCRADRSTPATFAVWEQVRTALNATAITATDRTMIVTTVTRDRTIAPEAERGTLTGSRVATERITQPWTSLSADSLHRAGYVSTDAEGYSTYYAPDVEVLLSDVFLTDHCLSVSVKDGHILVAFEPARDRGKLGELKGTVSLDRATFALERMEFNYTNVPPLQERAGGAIDFAHLANGAWIVTNWHITMPWIDRRTIASTVGRTWRPRTEYYVREFREHSGELALARRGADTLWKHASVTLTGVVRDSVTRRAIAGAYVTLVQAGRASVVDESGRFSFDATIPGEYTLTVQTPSLDSVGTEFRTQVSLADESSLVLNVPSALQTIGGICSPAPRSGAIVTGMVRRATAPAPNASVVAEWGDALAEHSRAIARTDASGRFRFCSLPHNTDVTFQAELGDEVSVRTTASVPDDRLMMTLSLPLTAQRERTATFRGSVGADSARRPLAGAEVALTDIGLKALTNEDGSFTFARIPAGEHRVFVRKLGYSQLDTTIMFAAGASLTHAIRLDRMATLDSMRVMATAFLRGFDENRKTGLGHFLDRSQLANLEGAPLSAIMQDMPGLGVIRGTGGRAWVASRRGGTSINGNDLTSGDRNDQLHGSTPACHPRVYIDRMQVFGGRGGEPLFDLSTMSPDRIEAMEVYASAAQVPAQYSGGGTDACGVVVIWLRRTFDEDKDKP